MSNLPRRCKAISPYVGKTEDELTFNVGDIIFVPPGGNSGKIWRGVLNGKSGTFPAIYVDDTTVEIKQAGTTTRVKALADYEAATEEELSFPKGAVMFVVARESEKYWKGVYKGKAGKIIASHVQDATDTATLKKKMNKKEEATGDKWEPAKCKAIRTHVAMEHGQLNFKIGETVFVPKPDPESATWQGVCNSQIGTFPAAYIVDVKQHTAEAIEQMIKDAIDTDEEKALQEALANERAQMKQALERTASKKNMDEPVLNPLSADELATAEATKADTDSPAAAPAEPEPAAAPAEPEPVAEAPAEDKPEEAKPAEPVAESAPEPAAEAPAAEPTPAPADAPAKATLSRAPSGAEPTETVKLTPKEQKAKAKADAKKAKEEEKARKKAEKEAAKQAKAEEKARKKAEKEAAKKKK